MVYHSRKSARLAARVSSDTGEIRSLDKLDKWIYLDPTASVVKDLIQYDEWDDVPPEVLQGHWVPETALELALHGVAPNELCRMNLTPLVVAHLFKHVVKHGIVKTHASDRIWRDMTAKVTEATGKAFQVQVEHLLGGVDATLFDINQPYVAGMLEKLTTLPPLVGKYWCAAEDFLNVIETRKHLFKEKYRRMRPRDKVERTFHDEEKRSGDNAFQIHLPSIKGSITMAHDISIFEFSGKKFILNEDLLLEVCNKTVETFCALLYNHMQSGKILPPNQYDGFVQFLSIIADIYTKDPLRTVANYSPHRSNIPFKFGKAIECLGVAFMIRSEDILEGWMNDRLLNAMWAELHDSGIVPTASIDQHPLGELFGRLSTPQIADMIGTVKLMGHPSIEIQLGANQLYERTHAQLAIDPIAVRSGMGVIIRDLIKAFLIKYKRFPEVNMTDPNLDPDVRDILERRVYPDSLSGRNRWNRITPLQWSTVEFLKNMEFDPVDNQLVLIKDKALGLTRSQIWNLLFEDANEDDKDKALQLLRRRELRRTLLSFLADTDFSRTFSQYFNNYSTQDPWNDTVLDYLVIKLTAKELELKEVGRFFGASPLVERNRRNVQEHNTKQLMSDLVNEQLMTQDELGIMRKLLSFRYFGNIYPEHYLYQISFDFSKWNNNFRRESVDVPGAHILDRWFGTNIYGKTMQAYEESLIYLREENFTRYWEGQLGGIEGLNQDTWSFLFLGGIKHALDEAGFKYQVTVKGDDVRAVIAVPESQIENEQDFGRIRDIILTRLQELCTSMGWQLNPQESFVSLTLIATSKQYQIRHTWLPAASKKIMKMMSLSNLLFPTLEELVGSIFSCAHSACSQSTAIIPAYLSALFVACWELYRGFHQQTRITTDMLAILAMWPQVIGGPGSLPLQTFFVRGENDMLSVSISLFTSLVRYHNGGLKPIAENVLKQRLDPQPDDQLLISDPYAVALDVPERPSSMLKRLIKDKLAKWVKNEDIRHLLSQKGLAEKEVFIRALASMEPYLAKVATVIYECSPFYLIEEILAKFMESPTVVALFSQGRLGRINMKAVERALGKIITAALNRVKYWVRVITGANRSDGKMMGVDRSLFSNTQICPTQIVQTIRDTAWKKPVVGITYPSLTTQVLVAPSMHFHKTWPDWNIQDLCYNIAVYADRAEPQTNLDSHHYASFGDNKPWEGTETASKVKMPKMDNLVRTPTLNKVTKLILLHQMLGNLGPQIKSALESCLAGLTRVDLKDIIMLMPRGEAGHVGHRLAINAFSTTTMPNYRHNILQLIRISDEHLTITKVDRTDRTINFVGVHFYIACISLFPLQMAEKLPDNYPRNLQAMFHPEDHRDPHYHMCPYCCCALIDNYIIRFKVPFPQTLYRFANLKLVGCSQYEETALLKAKADLVLHRARAAIRQDDLDPNDPLAVEEAANTVMSQLTDQSLMTLRAAVSADYYRVPTGALLDTVKANMGLASLSSVSITVLQAIPSGPIYRCLVTALAGYIIENIENTFSESGLFKLDLLAPYLNPLKHLFTKLISAGVMDRVVQGGIDAGWVNPPFALGGGDLTSPARCSQSFLLAHKPLFREWIEGRLLGIRFVPIIHMESDQAIQDVVMVHYKTRVRALSSIIISTSVNRPAWSTLGMALCRLMRNYPERGHRLHDHLKLLSLAEPIAMDANLRMLLLNLLTNEIDVDEDDVLYNVETLSAAVRVLLVLGLHWFIRPGEWFNLPPEQITRGANYDILVMDLDNLEVQELPDTLGECTENILSFIHYTSWEFYLVLRASALMIWTNVIWADNALSRSASRIVDLLLEQLGRWIIPYQQILINAVTEEESYRLLRAHGRLMENDPINRGRLITDILQLRAEARRNVHDQGLIAHRCRLQGRDYHQRLEGVHYQAPQGDPNLDLIREYIIETIGRAIRVEDYQDVQDLFSDPVEFYRSTGRHNTSISKYLEIFMKVDLVNRIQTHGGDVPLYICLADGLGGVTAYLLMTHVNAKVIYNSLLFDPSTGKPIADSGINQGPIEALDPFISTINRDSVMYRGFGDGDLSQKSVQDLIIDQNTRIDGCPLLITLDADINWDGPIESYYQLLWGAIYVAINCMADHTVCIFKTFLLLNSAFHSVITFLYNQFNHVHIYRSSCTRQHSCEIFLIFMEPRNLDVAKHDLRLLLQQNYLYPYNNTIVGLTTHQINPVLQDIARFRNGGIADGNLQVAQWCRTVAQLSGYPLRLDVILRWFGANADDHPECFCFLWNWIQQLAFRSWRSVTEDPYKDDHGRRRLLPVLTNARGRVMSTGRAFSRFLAIRVVCLAVLRVLSVMMVPCQSVLTIHQDAGAVLNDIYEMIHDALREGHARQEFELIYNRGYMFRSDRKYRDCLSLLVRQAIHKVSGLAGAIGLINSAIAGGFENHQARYLQAFYQGLQLRACCFERCRERWLVESREVYPLQGIPMRWDEIYHLFPKGDLTYDRQNNLPLRTMLRPADALVQEDEEVMDEIQNLNLDGPWE